MSLKFSCHGCKLSFANTYPSYVSTDGLRKYCYACNLDPWEIFMMPYQEIIGAINL